MESNIKNIIREVPGEQADLSFYFDGDCFNEGAGDYGYTLFIISKLGYGRLGGLNNFEWVDDEKPDYQGNIYCDEQAMNDAGIAYTREKWELLREWAKDADPDKPESIAAYLSITTGKEWGMYQALTAIAKAIIAKWYIARNTTSKV